MPTTNPPQDEQPQHTPVPARLRAGWSAVLESTRQVGSAMVRAVRHAGRERDLAVQSLKSALAALLAWVIATWLFTDGLSLMAPWVAVLMVQSTVYRSLSQGVRQTVAIVIGTALATGTALVLDNKQLLALMVVLPIALLMGNLQRFGSQGIVVATSSIFALTGGPVTPLVSAERVGAAAVGAVLGIAVNALIRPPRYLRDSRATVRDVTSEISQILAGVAASVEENDQDEATRLSQRAQQLPRRVTDVRSALEWNRESLRLNVRRRRAENVLPTDYTTGDVVHTLDQLADNARGLARVVEESMERTAEEPALPEWLRQTYARGLQDAAAAVEAYGRYITSVADAERLDLTDAVERAFANLDRLSARIDMTSLPDVGAMEIIGPLLSDTRRVVRALHAG